MSIHGCNGAGGGGDGQPGGRPVPAGGPGSGGASPWGGLASGSGRRRRLCSGAGSRCGGSPGSGSSCQTPAALQRAAPHTRARPGQNAEVSCAAAGIAVHLACAGVGRALCAAHILSAAGASRGRAPRRDRIPYPQALQGGCSCGSIRGRCRSGLREGGRPCGCGAGKPVRRPGAARRLGGAAAEHHLVCDPQLLLPCSLGKL